MVQLIKKGGLRERANRSSKYSQSENSIKTLDPHRYNTQNTVNSIENNPGAQHDSSAQSNINPDHNNTHLNDK